MNKILKSIIKIKEYAETRFLCFYGLLISVSFILITLKKVKIINISWGLSLMPLIIFILIMGAYLVLFFIDELKYQKEIRGMRRR